MENLISISAFLDKADDTYYYCFKDEGFHFHLS